MCIDQDPVDDVLDETVTVLLDDFFWTDQTGWIGYLLNTPIDRDMALRIVYYLQKSPHKSILQTYSLLGSLLQAERQLLETNVWPKYILDLFFVPLIWKNFST